ncbi:MAG TPA: energy transducer TonB [Gemmatimonadaceae bacterium]|nr:energy transducer TonB [Gemmatimonadaceae bacterium]
MTGKRIRPSTLSAFLLVAAACSCMWVNLPQEQDGSDWEWLPGANTKPADSTCQQILANGRTVSDTFYLHVRLGLQSTDEAARVFQRTVLQEILPYLRLPDTLAADFAWEADTLSWRRKTARQPSAKAASTGPDSVRPIGGELDAMLSFDLGRSGNVEALSVSFPSQVPAIHDSLVAAVRLAVATIAIPPIPDNLAAPQHFDVRLVVRERPEAEVTPVDTLQIRFPVYTKGAVVQAMQRPNYPARALEERRNGEVMTSFVIDPNGSMRPHSLRVLSANYSDFILEVARSLKTALFFPAEYRGCLIPVHVHQPFEFAVAG